MNQNQKTKRFGAGGKTRGVLLYTCNPRAASFCTATSWSEPFVSSRVCYAVVSSFRSIIIVAVDDGAAKPLSYSYLYGCSCLRVGFVSRDRSRRGQDPRRAGATWPPQIAIILTSKGCVCVYIYIIRIQTTPSWRTQGIPSWAYYILLTRDRIREGGGMLQTPIVVFGYKLAERIRTQTRWYEL